MSLNADLGGVSNQPEQLVDTSVQLEGTALTAAPKMLQLGEPLTSPAETLSDTSTHPEETTTPNKEATPSSPMLFGEHLAQTNNFVTTTDSTRTDDSTTDALLSHNTITIENCNEVLCRPDVKLSTLKSKEKKSILYLLNQYKEPEAKRQPEAAKTLQNLTPEAKATLQRFLDEKRHDELQRAKDLLYQEETHSNLGTYGQSHINDLIEENNKPIEERDSIAQETLNSLTPEQKTTLEQYTIEANTDQKLQNRIRNRENNPTEQKKTSFLKEIKAFFTPTNRMAKIGSDESKRFRITTKFIHALQDAKLTILTKAEDSKEQLDDFSTKLYTTLKDTAQKIAHTRTESRTNHPTLNGNPIPRQQSDEKASPH